MGTPTGDTDMTGPTLDEVGGLVVGVRVPRDSGASEGTGGGNSSDGDGVGVSVEKMLDDGLSVGASVSVGKMFDDGLSVGPSEPDEGDEDFCDVGSHSFGISWQTVG